MALPTLVRTGIFELTDLRSYLIGAWTLERTVADLDGSQLQLRGEAVVEERADGSLVYRERATLQASSRQLEFSRTYRYTPTGLTSADVSFADGAFFYPLDLSRARCSVTHDCADDRYLGLIVATERAWFTRWRCRGPLKNYVVTTKLTRRASSPATSSA